MVGFFLAVGCKSVEAIGFDGVSLYFLFSFVLFPPWKLLKSLTN